MVEMKYKRFYMEKNKQFIQNDILHLGTCRPAENLSNERDMDPRAKGILNPKKPFAYFSHLEVLTELSPTRGKSVQKRIPKNRVFRGKASKRQTLVSLVKKTS